MKMCIPIRARSPLQLNNKIKRALRKKPDFLEIWLDRFSSFSLAQLKNLIKSCKAPVIAVCRGKAEKGGFGASERERIDVLIKALNSGALFVDCGVDTDKSLLLKLKKACALRGAKFIVSKHFYNGTPDLEILLAAVAGARRLGADIVKIACRVKNWSDNAILFELTAREAAGGKKIIVLGMGEKGKISRCGCPMLGSYLAFTSLDEKSKTAAGQMTVEEFRAAFKGF